MTKYDTAIVRPATLADAAQLAPNLRKADLAELDAATKDSPQAALELGVRCSVVSYAVTLADGEVVALFGVAPSQDPMLGHVWLLGSDKIKDIRLTFLRHSKEWLEKLFKGYRVLGNFVDARNTLHISWLKWLGFRFLRRVPLGRSGEEFIEFIRLKEAV